MGQVHNGLERAGNLTAGLKDAVGATDSEGGLERFGETLTPVIDIWSMPEWMVLRDERLIAGFRLQAAVAAEFSAIALLNPTGSRTLVVLESVSADTSAAGNVYQLQVCTEAQILATLAGGIPGARRDSRVPNITAPSVASMLIGSDPAATIGQNMEQRRMQNLEVGPVDFLSPPLVFSPGFGCVVVCQTVNIGFVANFKWRERSCFSAELG